MNTTDARSDYAQNAGETMHVHIHYYNEWQPSYKPGPINQITAASMLIHAIAATR